MEDQKALKTRAIVRKTARSINNSVDHLLADRVMPASVVVRRVFLPADHLLRMKEIFIVPPANLIDDSWLQIAEYRPWHVLALARFGEESVESIVGDSDGAIAGHRAIWRYSMLETVQFPASVADLDSGLSDVD